MGLGCPQTLAPGKHNQLRPPRSGFAAGDGILIFVGRLHRQEIFAAHDAGLNGLHAVAKLGSLDHALAVAAAVSHEGVGFPCWVSLVGVPGIPADAVPVRGDNLIAPRFVAACLHEPINDHQPPQVLFRTRAQIAWTSGTGSNPPSSNAVSRFRVGRYTFDWIKSARLAGRSTRVYAGKAKRGPARRIRTASGSETGPGKSVRTSDLARSLRPTRR
jgi:hypothetical protein